jgi:hypothetical protein
MGIMPNEILDGMSREEALSNMNTDAFVFNGVVYICPAAIGLEQHPNILTDGCRKCWIRSINSYYDEKEEHHAGF